MEILQGVDRSADDPLVPWLHVALVPLADHQTLSLHPGGSYACGGTDHLEGGSSASNIPIISPDAAKIPMFLTSTTYAGTFLTLSQAGSLPCHQPHCQGSILLRALGPSCSHHVVLTTLPDGLHLGVQTGDEEGVPPRLRVEERDKEEELILEKLMRRKMRMIMRRKRKKKKCHVHIGLSP